MENNPSRNQPKKNKWGILGSIGALILAFGARLKFLIPLLKWGKAGGTIWSMLLMVGAYALIYPWTFAVGIVVMIFIHEMGHVIAAKQKNLPVSAPAFIPFLGALITMKKQPQNAEVEAYLALGGPIFGSLGALVALLIGIYTGYEPLFAVAMIGFFLNLINLLPIHPLDGGRIVTAISRWLWLVGLVGGLVVILYLRAFIFLFFWILFAIELYQTYIGKRKIKTAEKVEQITLPKMVFTNHFFPVPGPEHRRELTFTQYSVVETKTSMVDIYYPGLGFIGRIPFPHGDITRLELAGAITDYSRDDVTLNLRFTYKPSVVGGLVKDEAYYQVPTRIRFIYGFVYFSLIILLGWLMLISLQLSSFTT